LAWQAEPAAGVPEATDARTESDVTEGEDLELAVAEASDSPTESDVSDGADLDCPVCLLSLQDDDEEEPLHTTACGHVFHAECLGEWMSTCKAKGLDLTCPSCRAKLTD
jgi:hypothetical protein